MDKLFSDELQYYIEASRLKTARQKRRAVITARDKQLLRIEKQENALREKRRHPIYVPLKPPIQKGFYRFFVLRDDVARGRQASFFQGILDKINTEQHFHRRDFKKKKRVRGKKIWVDKEQQLKRFFQWEFDKLNFTKQEMAYFEVRMIKHGKKEKETPTWVFTQPWRFVLRIRPYLLTHRRIVDPLIESQLQEIKNYIDDRNLRPRMRWLTQSRHDSWRRWNPEKDKEKYKKKTLLQIVQEEYYDNID